MKRLAGAIIAIALIASVGAAQIADEDALFDTATQAVRDRDFRTAVSLFETLAEADVPDAQYNLAVLLRAGRGRPQNNVEALYWSALALLGGGNYAAEMVDDLLNALPTSAREDVITRLLARLTAQVEAGRIAAPRQLARVYAELMAEPDARMAYIWYSICYALGENDCAEGRDEMVDEIESEDLIGVQAEASETFAALSFPPVPAPHAVTAP
jgi:TPR repeat protein